jgi:hypothetical protein
VSRRDALDEPARRRFGRSRELNRLSILDSCVSLRVGEAGGDEENKEATDGDDEGGWCRSLDLLVISWRMLEVRLVEDEGDRLPSRLRLPHGCPLLSTAP